MASAGRPQAGRTAVRLFRWCVPKKSLCSLPKVKAFPREQWFQSRWFLTNFGARRFPKGNEGKRVSSGYNRRRRLATRSSGKQQAERTAVRTAPIVCPEESPLVRPQAQTFCRWGLTRRLRRGRWGCRPDGGSYFLSARKKVPKKACGTATPGKRLLLPILTAGLAMSRAMELDSFHQRFERARARLFPPSKWAGLFPSAAYRRPAPPQLALSRLKRRCLGCFDVAEMALHRKTADLVFALRLV